MNIYGMFKVEIKKQGCNSIYTQFQKENLFILNCFFGTYLYSIAK